MPKPNSSSRPTPPTPAVARVDAACRRVTDGKLAARDLIRWLATAGVSESEFRLLWALFQCCGTPDQADLAAQLAVSAAQVSVVVERLQSDGLIVGTADPGDRRRQLWRLSPTGGTLVHAVLAQVAAAGKEAA
jgi:DNA-binding MarR family transcriptional regulator